MISTDETHRKRRCADAATAPDGLTAGEPPTRNLNELEGNLPMGLMPVANV